MNSSEKRVAIALSGVFATRMLGLFMVLPVFAIYAENLHGFTPTLAGIAIGIYGLTQALLQIPLGRLSDRVGRKPIIIGGLVVFALGSVIAAMADSITGVIIGRAIQGSGAIASAVMALAADLTREEHRMKVMASIGMSIGLAFAVAIIMGPVLHSWFGVSGIFWTTAGLAVLAIAIIGLVVPTPVTTRFHRDTEVEFNWLGRVARHPQLLRLDLGVFVLHFVMTATMFALPVIWVKTHHFDVANHWWVYLPVMALSLVLVIPFIIIGEKKRQLKQIVVLSVVALASACLLLWWQHNNWWFLAMGLWLFFVGFNLLEASLPSLIAKFAPAAHKGTAMGVFSSAQFLGAFFGATSAGWVSEHFGPGNVFIVNAVLVALWLGMAISMRQPPYLSSELVNVGQVDKQQAQELVMHLTAIRGVAEAVVIPEDGVAYLKVDKNALDREALLAYSNVGYSTDQKDK
ncbi:Inner membrane transport protein YajR [hydrothermal vent metagenome]|uniref:Inner membrane transport protein YajR n=1 Tax=hydrothermal vent metagenome TaxID=652676 RepID=A0A3B0ZB02_9ZZZZ